MQPVGHVAAQLVSRYGIACGDWNTDQATRLLSAFAGRDACYGSKATEITDIAERLTDYRSAGNSPRSRRLAAPNGLAHLEPLELRVIEIQRLVVSRAAMRGPERFRSGPCLEYSAVLPPRAGGVGRVILG